MKFKITLKDPDGVYEGIREAARETAESVEGLSKHEREDLIEGRREDLYELCSKWFQYGEYLTVEIDTEAGTCVVVPSK